MSSATQLGRPRAFDKDETLDRAVEVFWRLGMSGSTTRRLESELGLTQSSIYNAFGSKTELATQVIDRYIEQLKAEVVGHIDAVDAGFVHFDRFLSDLVEWVSHEKRPGCLLLNLSAEQGVNDLDLVERLRAYRLRLRELFVTLLSNESVANPDASADVLLAGVLGMNVAARTGANRAEIDRFAEGLRGYVELLKVKRS